MNGVKILTKVENCSLELNQLERSSGCDSSGFTSSAFISSGFALLPPKNSTIDLCPNIKYAIVTL